MSPKEQPPRNPDLDKALAKPLPFLSKDEINEARYPTLEPILKNENTTIRSR